MRISEDILAQRPFYCDSWQSFRHALQGTYGIGTATSDNMILRIYANLSHIDLSEILDLMIPKETLSKADVGDRDKLVNKWIAKIENGVDSTHYQPEVGVVTVKGKGTPKKKNKKKGASSANTDNAKKRSLSNAANMNTTSGNSSSSSNNNNDNNNSSSNNNSNVNTGRTDLQSKQSEEDDQCISQRVKAAMESIKTDTGNASIFSNLYSVANKSMERPAKRLKKGDVSTSATAVDEAIIDDRTKRILMLLEQAKVEAAKIDEFDRAKSIKEMVGEIKKYAYKLVKIEALKEEAVKAEDYDYAKEVKAQCEDLRQEMDEMIAELRIPSLMEEREINLEKEREKDKDRWEKKWRKEREINKIKEREKEKWEETEKDEVSGAKQRKSSGANTHPSIELRHSYISSSSAGTSATASTKSNTGVSTGTSTSTNTSASTNTKGSEPKVPEIDVALDKDLRDVKNRQLLRRSLKNSLKALKKVKEWHLSTPKDWSKTEQNAWNKRGDEFTAAIMGVSVLSPGSDDPQLRELWAHTAEYLLQRTDLPAAQCRTFQRRIRDVRMQEHLARKLYEEVGIDASAEVVATHLRKRDIELQRIEKIEAEAEVVSPFASASASASVSVSGDFEVKVVSDKAVVIVDDSILHEGTSTEIDLRESTKRAIELGLRDKQQVQHVDFLSSDSEEEAQWTEEEGGATNSSISNTISNTARGSNFSSTVKSKSSITRNMKKRKQNRVEKNTFGDNSEDSEEAEWTENEKEDDEGDEEEGDEQEEEEEEEEDAETRNAKEKRVAAREWKEAKQAQFARKAKKDQEIKDLKLAKEIQAREVNQSNRERCQPPTRSKREAREVNQTSREVNQTSRERDQPPTSPFPPPPTRRERDASDANQTSQQSRREKKEETRREKEARELRESRESRDEGLVGELRRERAAVEARDEGLANDAKRAKWDKQLSDAKNARQVQQGRETMNAIGARYTNNSANVNIDREAQQGRDAMNAIGARYNNNFNNASNTNSANDANMDRQVQEGREAMAALEAKHAKGVKCTKDAKDANAAKKKGPPSLAAADTSHTSSSEHSDRKNAPARARGASSVNEVSPMEGQKQQGKVTQSRSELVGLIDELSQFNQPPLPAPTPDAAPAAPATNVNTTNTAVPNTTSSSSYAGGRARTGTRFTDASDSSNSGVKNIATSSSSAINKAPSVVKSAVRGVVKSNSKSNNNSSHNDTATGVPSSIDLTAMETSETSVQEVKEVEVEEKEKELHPSPLLFAHAPPLNAAAISNTAAAVAKAVAESSIWPESDKSYLRSVPFVLQEQQTDRAVVKVVGALIDPETHADKSNNESNNFHRAVSVANAVVPLQNQDEINTAAAVAAPAEATSSASISAVKIVPRFVPKQTAPTPTPTPTQPAMLPLAIQRQRQQRQGRQFDARDIINSSQYGYGRDSRHHRDDRDSRDSRHYSDGRDMDERYNRVSRHYRDSDDSRDSRDNRDIRDRRYPGGGRYSNSSNSYSGSPRSAFRVDRGFESHNNYNNHNNHGSNHGSYGESLSRGQGQGRDGRGSSEINRLEVRNDTNSDSNITSSPTSATTAIVITATATKSTATTVTGNSTGKTASAVNIIATAGEDDALAQSMIQEMFN